MTRRNLFRYLGSGGLAALFAPGELLGTDSASRDGTYTTNPGALGETLYPLYSAVRDKFSLEDGKDVLLIDGQEQMMYLASEEGGSLRVSRVYPVSTSRRGFGNRFGSGKTPLGIHMIKEKYGGDAPVGAVFRDRSYTGRIARISDYKPGSPGKPWGRRKVLMTSRLMWLDGAEESNRNTLYRNIYIHGTSDESSIGLPHSHGCIRMKNCDVVELYDLVDVGTYVNIAKRLNIRHDK